MQERDVSASVLSESLVLLKAQMGGKRKQRALANFGFLESKKVVVKSVVGPDDTVWYGSVCSSAMKVPEYLHHVARRLEEENDRIMSYLDQSTQ